MDAGLLGSLIAAGATVATSVIALWSAALLRRAQRRADAESQRAKSESERSDRLLTENSRLDARYGQMLDNLQEENSRLREILRDRERGCTG